MISKRDWQNAIDDVMIAIGGVGSVGAVHKAIVEYHGKTYNKPLNVAMTCGRCAATMWFGVTRIAAHHWTGSEAPQAVACPNQNCGHTGVHNYSGIVK